MRALRAGGADPDGSSLAKRRLPRFEEGKSRVAQRNQDQQPRQVASGWRTGMSRAVGNPALEPDKQQGQRQASESYPTLQCLFVAHEWHRVPGVTFNVDDRT